MRAALEAAVKAVAVLVLLYVIGFALGYTVTMLTLDAGSHRQSTLRDPARGTVPASSSYRDCVR